ncbi:glycosyltransferase family 8 protein [Paracoccus onubensis]|uniref:glycosyltransferase family 8 protein n=1 Tax=Paracoccus onubensis TaxID=1675788 RepID=UPI002731A58A|nr:glycosyltransferase family 8 protein [Paracoccus onubensis]MDP0929353.1 glycosyltransferase family 8 protein [Paracoccus onubensis]
MTPMTSPKIVYVTDAGFLKPTLVSVWSLLKTISGKAELHIWGDNLDDEHWQSISRVAAINPDVTLLTKNLEAEHLKGAHGPKDYISAATMGRLFIPAYIDGYALYIDGDTLVVNDVTPLFEIDLGSAYAGVIRDYTLLHWLANPKTACHDGRARISEVTTLLHPTPPTDYFNAGIMLFNCDQIRSEPELMQNVEDVCTASDMSHGDQDHLNVLFKENVRFLDIMWNLSWGRSKRHREIFRKLDLPEYELLPDEPRIIHYHGPQKPWRNPRKDIWSSKGKATFHYRRQLQQFSADFPDLRPE